VAGVNRIVEIDAGEDGEDIGLEERHQRLQCEENDNHQQGKRAADPANDAKTGAEQNDETGEDLERDVPCEHVCKQPHAV